MHSSLLTGSLSILSRREFLKRAGTLALGAGLLPIDLATQRWGFHLPETEVPRQGRVTVAKTDGYASPSFQGELTHTYGRDYLVAIQMAVLGDEDSGHNRIWYFVNGESYVHSGDIQPVAQNVQIPRNDLGDQPALVEVSVPYTDSVWDVYQPTRSAYRLYYGCTFWALAVKAAADGSLWYRIQDDKWDYSYYAKGEHLRLVQAQDVAPLAPQVPDTVKRVAIHLPEQIVIAYEDDQPVFMARAATGAKFSSGDYRTPPGTYITNRKRPSRHMAAGDPAAGNGYDLPGIPWVSYLMDNGISFHGTYWHNNYGQPRSHGCINLTPQDSLWIYRWTTPGVPLQTVTITEKTGTMVQIIDTAIG